MAASVRISACPRCGTRFQVSEGQLAVADGQVRCGACLAVFDGRARLETPLDTAEPAPSLTADPSAAIRATEALAADSPVAPRRGSTGYLAWSLVAGLALFFNAGALLNPGWVFDPEMRGVAETVCGYVNPLLPCELPVYRAVADIELQDGPAPVRDNGQFILQTGLASRAPFAQPLPVLVLQFADVNRTVMAQHRHRPADYLSAPSTETPPLLRPGEPVAVALRIADPGPDAAHFRISLR